MYKPVFKKYGEKARFVLTVRKDADTWFESIKRHNRYAHPILNRHWRVFGRYYPHGFDREHKAYYERHIQDANSFFEQHGATDQLLMLRVDEPDSIERLAKFLDLEIPLSEFPRENVSKGDRRDLGSLFKWRYNKLVQPLYEAVFPRISSGVARQELPIEMDWGDRDTISSLSRRS